MYYAQKVKTFKDLKSFAKHLFDEGLYLTILFNKFRMTLK